jgi:hypothetical protein
MICELHGVQMEYMGEVMGVDLWSCPECNAEEEYEAQRCPYCGEEPDDCLCEVWDDEDYDDDDLD